jgi:hypothetical protein
MARARRRRRLGVSLFPFLSVLACVIGTLTLMIAATAIGEVATDALDLEQVGQLERHIADGRRRLAELTAIVAETDALGVQIEAEQQAKAGLAHDAEQARAAIERSAPLAQALAREQARIQNLERERDALAKQAHERQDKLERLRQARAAAPILIQPSGSGYGLKPLFAECRSEGLVLYEGLARHRTEVAMHRIATSAEYRRFLQRAQDTPGSTIVFLIRPGGVPAYNQAALQARGLQQRFGEIPLPGDGQLDFSMLQGSGG